MINMNSSNLENVWKIMYGYNFSSEDNLINENLKCSICDKLMIDACQSVCGCQYCHKCISRHLEDGNRYCPGDRKECQEEHLSIDHDVWRNMRKNNKIMKVKVKCLNERCQCKIELKDLVDHLKECIEDPVICPYMTIGCIDRREETETISKHLQKDTIFHARLITQWIQNVKNEIDGLHQNVEISQLKLVSLTKDSEFKEIQVEEQRREIDYIRKESRNKEKLFEIELEEIRNEIESKLSTFSGETGRERNIKGRQLMETTNLERKGNNNLQLLVDNLREEVNDIRGERQNLIEQIDKLNKKLNSLRKEKEKVGNNEGLMLQQVVYMDYVWRIYDLTRKIDLMPWSPIFSESFSSNNYKLCLRLYIDNDNIGLYCFIMKGENDDNLQWPMRKTVTLSIVNQNTLRPHKSASFQIDYYGRDKSAFGRPSTEMNYYCIGAYPFILYSEIINKPSVIVNDSIVASCVLSDN